MNTIIFSLSKQDRILLNYSFYETRPIFDDFDISYCHTEGKKGSVWYQYPSLEEGYDLAVVILDVGEKISPAAALHVITRNNGTSLSRDNLFQFTYMSENFKKIQDMLKERGGTIHIDAPAHRSVLPVHPNSGRRISPRLSLPRNYHWLWADDDNEEIMCFVYFVPKKK